MSKDQALWGVIFFCGPRADAQRNPRFADAAPTADSWRVTHFFNQVRVNQYAFFSLSTCAEGLRDGWNCRDALRRTHRKNHRAKRASLLAWDLLIFQKIKWSPTREATTAKRPREATHSDVN